MQDRYEGYWVENKAILRGLAEIQHFRNRLAHSVIDVSDEALSRPISDGVGFIQWKKGEPVTDGEFDEYIVRANMISSALTDIRELLRF